MTFQHEAPTSAAVSSTVDPRMVGSSLKESIRHAHPSERTPSSGVARGSAPKPRRHQGERSVLPSAAARAAPTSDAVGSSTNVAQPPADIASALVAYQRRQARFGDNRTTAGRSRSARRYANKEGELAATSSDDAHRDKSGGVNGNHREEKKATRVVPSAEAASPSSPSKRATELIADAVGGGGSGGSGSGTGRRSRQTSEKGVLPDLRLSARSRLEQQHVPAPTILAQPAFHPRAAVGFSRRDRNGRSSEGRHALASQDFSSGRDSRQLFDPRRHDPVKFASQQRSQPQVEEHSRQTISGGNQANAQSILASTLATESRVETFAASQASAAAASQTRPGGPEISGAYTVQMHVQEIKQLYRRICALEAKLQQAHRSEADRQRDAVEVERLKLQPNLDHDYWLGLAAEHRELAELQTLFLEMTLRSDVPESVQELPHNYNLPTRLWQTGFHMMLERLRHNLPSAVQVRTTDRGSELLDHLTEFIYFAYSFYTTLFETEKFRTFRRAWIESLGDLARYRMAVAGLASSLALDADSGVRNKEGRGTGNSRRNAEDMRIDDDDDDGSHVPPDGASIGSDALGDWEFVEKETWRQTARDWYARGLAEAPNVGRLHHHLGILSRGDELRTLYHFCRSLTSSHPFTSAKETILSLFDQEHQARRLQGDASAEDLFVYLHGTLITRVQLDDFDDVFARFREKMGCEGVLGLQRSFSEATWMIMASVNIAGLLQYGAEGSLLLQSLLRKAARSNDGRPFRTDKGKVATPKAIMVNPAAKAEDGHVGGFAHQADLSDDASEELSDAGDEAGVIHLESKDEASEVVPTALAYAMKLAFFLLDFCLRSDNHQAGNVNPYVTELMTFYFSVARFRPIYRLTERYMPWPALIDQLQALPLGIVAKASKESALCITGKYPLPEDWCLRGTAGIGKQTYDRALWKKSIASTSSSSLPIFRTEAEVLDSENSELHDKFQSALVPSKADRSGSLEDLRLYRLAFIAVRLARTARGLDFDPRDQRFSICKPLLARLSRWKNEEQQELLESQLQRIKLAKSLDPSGRNTLLTQEDLVTDTESDVEVDAIEGESEHVRQLRARKRYLKDVLRSTKAILESSASQKQAKRQAGPPGKKKASTQHHHLLPGYTVLLMDTNVLVTPGDLLRQLVESQKWTVVIPLAVVTELDGLKRNDNALGEEALRAIQFLETHIRSHATYLKVQTSRGNYLTDLSIRSEDMRFGFQPSDAQSTDDPHAQKSIAARNVDEVIIRCLSWQTDHFVDRLPLLTANPAAERLKLQEATAKAALLTLDRNLRVKAKARGLCGLDEKDIAELMITTVEETVQTASPTAAAKVARGKGS